MPIKPPLSSQELARVRARYEPSATRAPCSYQDTAVWADVLLLLHEIKRMRSMLMRAEQLRDRFPPPSNCLDEIWEEFQRDLACEPCVRERSAWKQDLLEPAKRRRQAQP